MHDMSFLFACYTNRMGHKLGPLSANYLAELGGELQAWSALGVSTQARVHLCGEMHAALPSQVLSLLGATELEELVGDPQGLRVGELHIESKVGPNI